MRIISGKHKGRKIKAPLLDEVRPTTDFAKTGLFNILNNKIDYERVVVLDLFCGFGNISLEMASRGCNNIDAVDENIQCVRFLKNFAQTLSLPIETYQSDVIQYLKKCSRKYDIIFADPPYEHSDLLDNVITIVQEKNILNKNGLLILEHEKHKSFSEHKCFIDERHYGKVYFSFLQF